MSLKCEKCGHEPAGRDCLNCGETVPRRANYCPHCGADLPAEMEESEGQQTGRRLCPDGDCIGILNADGRCVVCGRKTGKAGKADAAA